MNVYRIFYWCMVAVALAGFSSAYMSNQHLQIILACLCVGGIFSTALISAGFPKNRKIAGNYPVLVAGAVFIVGGAAFDVYATLHHSPDLAYEANPIARVLLDGGVEAGHVVLLGLLAQAALVAASVMVWVNFVVRMDWYKDAIASAGDVRLVGRVVGATDNRWSSLAGGRIRHDVLVSSLGFIIIPLFAYRWYLGLEWFGLVPISRVVVPVTLMLLAGITLLAWGHKVSKTPAGRPGPA